VTGGCRVVLADPDVPRIGSAKTRHVDRGKSAQGATKNRRYLLRGKNTLAMAAEKAHAALWAASSPVFFAKGRRA
jgi:hypothetical protein